MDEGNLYILASQQELYSGDSYYLCPISKEKSTHRGASLFRKMPRILTRVQLAQAQSVY